MAGPGLPSIPDLAQLQFLPPGLNALAGQNIQLGQQSAQQSLDMGTQDIRSKQLQNLFDESNNPTRILQGKANLEGTTAENIVKNIEAKQRQTLAPEELEAKRAKFVKELSDTKLDQALIDAQQMMLSDDPKIAAKGSDLFARSGKEQSARLKAKDEQDKQRLANEGSNESARIHAGATVQAAQISANARQAVANAKGNTKDIVTTVLTKPVGTQYAAFTALSQRAAEQGDAENAALYGSLAESLRPQAEATLNARPDPSKLNLPEAAGMPGQAPVRLPTNPNLRNAPAPAAPAASKPALPPGVTLVK